MTRPLALEQYEKDIDAQLRQMVGSTKSPLYRMMHYQLGWVDREGMPTHRLGERTFGTLLLLIAETGGVKRSVALPFAAAIEMLGAAFDVHQSLKAGLPGPNESPGLWWVFGSAQGINAGDGFYALARLKISEATESRSETVLRANALLDKACLDCVDAQSRVRANGIDNQSVEAYLSLISRLAGPLPVCAVEIGAWLAGARTETANCLTNFAQSFAEARFLRLEIASIWGAGTGSNGHLIDALDKRRTLPVIYALGRSGDADREIFEAARRRERLLTDSELLAVLQAMERTGAKSYAEETAQKRGHAAAESLRNAGLPPKATEEITAFARYAAGLPS